LNVKRISTNLTSIFKPLLFPELAVQGLVLEEALVAVVCLDVVVGRLFGEGSARLGKPRDCQHKDDNRWTHLQQKKIGSYK
jgi:hypothetical protein